MKTLTQTMTGANNLADATEKAIELSRNYEQSFLAKIDPIRNSVAYTYIVFTHNPFLKDGDELLAHYENGEIIN